MTRRRARGAGGPEGGGHAGERGAGHSPRPTWQLLRLGWAREGHAAGVLGVWLLWERILERRQRIRPVRDGAVFRFAVTRRRRRRVVLGDGTAIERGDVVLELHFDNRRLVELAAARSAPWPLLRQFRDDLTALREQIAAGALGPVKALHGVTMFAAGGRRLGFEVRPVPRTWYAALQRFFMAGLVVLYHPAGWEAARRHAGRWPGEVWMSTTALERRYPAADATSPSPGPAELRDRPA